MSRIDLGDILDVITAVRPVIDKAVKNKDVSLQKKDAPAITNEVTAAVNDNVAAAQHEVDQTIRNLENKEPWYQSRVMWGTIVTAGFQLAAIVGIKTDFIDSESLVNIIMQVVSLGGAAYAAYGRLVTNKPLGE